MDRDNRLALSKGTSFAVRTKKDGQTTTKDICSHLKCNDDGEAFPPPSSTTNELWCGQGTLKVPRSYGSWSLTTKSKSQMKCSLRWIFLLAGLLAVLTMGAMYLHNQSPRKTDRSDCPSVGTPVPCPARLDIHDTDDRLFTKSPRLYPFELFDFQDKLVSLNIGPNFSPVKLKKGGPVEKMLLFEPLFEACAEFTKKLDPDIYGVYCVGISNRTYMATFRTYARTGVASSLAVINPDLNQKLSSVRKVIVLQAKNVLEELLGKGNSIAYLKTDTQGFDKVILEDIAAFLPQILCVKAECYCPGYKGSYLNVDNYCDDIVELLEKAGFQASYKCVRDDEADVLARNPKHPHYAESAKIGCFG